MNIKIIRQKKTECIVLALYIIGVSVLSAFHEACFDEAQAWEIARCASVREILTVIPHYEGHPPLWHLILLPFARSGAQFDVSLHLINILFSTCAMGLLLFRSPFPKIVRYFLPFTYFFFYQYGVIGRPYSLMMLAVMLAAVTYTDRNRHPWNYILALCLMCLCSAYGIMISGGLCAVWTAEILTELHRNKNLKSFWKDARFWALCMILLLAAVLILMILPAEDCYYDNIEENSTVQNLLSPRSWAVFLIISFDAWFGEYLSYARWSTNDTTLIIESAGSIIMWAMLIPLLMKNKKCLTYLIPYILFSGFMVFHYFSPHHMGIFIMFHIFIFWVMGAQPQGMEIPEYFRKLFGRIDSPAVKKSILGLAGALCAVPVIYTAVSAWHEVRGLYSPACFAEFIQENHLEDRKILLAWDVKSDSDSGADFYPTHYMPAPHAEIKAHHTEIAGLGSLLSVYFDRNIFMNFNISSPEDLYMHYRYKEDVGAVFEQWRNAGLPDFIIDYCPIDEVYGEEMLKETEYVCIEEVEAGMIFKLNQKDMAHRIFIRKDLLAEYPQFHQIYS